MKKILTIVGARPQFVKAATVSRVLQQNSGVKEVLVHTGQHYDENMSKIFFDDLEISPITYQLEVHFQHQGQQTGEMLGAIENVLLIEKPDWVLIYGDTNSTLAGALAAAKLHIPIAHVEAGLRSYNRSMPEEINRLIADQLSNVLFTPTMTAVKNLKREGYHDSRIIHVGDVMYDAALFYGEKANQTSSILEKLNLSKNAYILATVHRAENTNNINKLKHIFFALDQISATLPVIMPLHPRTKKMIDNFDINLLDHTRIQLIEPVGFLDMIMLEKNASLVVTDSGGIQKEAFFYQVPCVTLRDETEWVETVELGWNTIIPAKDDMHQRILSALGTVGIQNQSPYGDGEAAKKIVQYLSEGEHKCVFG